MYGVSYNIPYITERYKMENNAQFKITYYSNKDKKHITRNGKWDEKCKYWTSKMGAKLIITGTGRSPESYPEDEKKIGWKDIESTAEQIREVVSMEIGRAHV